uniref:Uncharacterized protein n=1 Tax=Biomphalaria glabrata TaxID=6526 RepID=A0A2C9LD08_BIOGL
MYQNGSGHPSLSSLTSAHSTLNMVPPTSTSTSPYSHESLASSFMHSGSTPVYVPTNRPSLHSSHMSAYGVGNGGSQQNPSSLSGTPTGSSMWQTDNLGMAYSAQTTPTRFGFSPPQSGQIMSSDSSAVAAAAYAGTSLPRTPTALNPYSPYMRADFNAWSSFSNMALQGFKQTVDHDSGFTNLSRSMCCTPDLTHTRLFSPESTRYKDSGLDLKVHTQNSSIGSVNLKKDSLSDYVQRKSTLSNDDSDYVQRKSTQSKDDSEYVQKKSTLSSNDSDNDIKVSSSAITNWAPLAHSTPISKDGRKALQTSQRLHFNTPDKKAIAPNLLLRAELDKIERTNSAFNHDLKIS